ncbi:MAG TPA: J domain-containing protein [Patescibacteria group bacterium]|nr:J domain-containing protein [Patescibacteria group bacterium]
MAQQPEFQDYYKTLGVPRSATQADIKKAFRKLARESHPDKHAGDKAAEQRFKEINEANAVLSDPGKRAKYDQFGRDWEAYARAGAAAGGASGGRDPFAPGGPFAGYTYRTSGTGGPGGVRYEFRTSGDPGAFSDFFRMMFGDESAAAGEPETFSTEGGESIDDLLSRLGMAGAAPGAGRARPHAGGTAGHVASNARRAPIEVTAELSLEEAFHGTTRIVELEGRRLELTIPRGANNGSRIRLTGKGPDGRDLVVVTRIKPHRAFTRKGDDLERVVPLTLKEALLGGEIPVGTLKGRVLLTVPAGTQDARTFRLKGQGMPRFKGDGTGDLFVKVKVILPTALDDAATAAARKFLDLVDQPDPRT